MKNNSELELHIVNYLRTILLVAIWSMFSQFEYKILYKIPNEWAFTPNLSFLNQLPQTKMFLVLVVGASISAIFCLLKPKIQVSRFLCFILISLIMGLTGDQFKVNHNIQFYIVTLLACSLIPFKKNKLKEQITGLVFIPLIFSSCFLLAGINKLSILVTMLFKGQHLTEIFHPYALSSRITSTFLITEKINFLQELFVKFPYATSWLYYFGIIFQLFLFFAVWFYPKLCWLWGFLFMSFMLFMGFIIGAFFNETFILGLVIFFLFPLNDYNFFKRRVTDVEKS